MVGKRFKRHSQHTNEQPLVQKHAVDRGFELLKDKEFHEAVLFFNEKLCTYSEQPELAKKCKLGLARAYTGTGEFEVAKDILVKMNYSDDALSFLAYARALEAELCFLRGFVFDQDRLQEKQLETEMAYEEAIRKFPSFRALRDCSSYFNEEIAEELPLTFSYPQTRIRASSNISIAQGNTTDISQKNHKKCF